MDDKERGWLMTFKIYNSELSRHLCFRAWSLIPATVSLRCCHTSQLCQTKRSVKKELEYRIKISLKISKKSSLPRLSPSLIKSIVWLRALKQIIDRLAQSTQSGRVSPTLPPRSRSAEICQEFRCDCV